MPPTFNPFHQPLSPSDSQRLEDIKIFIEGLPDLHQDSTPVLASPFSSPKAPDTVDRDRLSSQHNAHDDTGPGNDAQSAQLFQVSSALVDVMASLSAMNDMKESEMNKTLEAPAATLEESNHDVTPISRATTGNLINGFDATDEGKSILVAPVEEAVPGKTQKEEVVPRDGSMHQEGNTDEATPISRPTTGNLIGDFDATDEGESTPVLDTSLAMPLEQATKGNLIDGFDTTGEEKPTPMPESSPVAPLSKATTCDFENTSEDKPTPLLESSPVAPLEKAVQDEAQKEEVVLGEGSTPEAMMVLTPQQDSSVRVTNPEISSDENKHVSGLQLSKYAPPPNESSPVPCGDLRSDIPGAPQESQPSIHQHHAQADSLNTIRVLDAKLRDANRTLDIERKNRKAVIEAAESRIRGYCNTAIQHIMSDMLDQKIRILRQTDDLQKQRANLAARKEVTSKIEDLLAVGQKQSIDAESHIMGININEEIIREKVAHEIALRSRKIEISLETKAKELKLREEDLEAREKMAQNMISRALEKITQYRGPPETGRIHTGYAGYNNTGTGSRPGPVYREDPNFGVPRYGTRTAELPVPVLAGVPSRDGSGAEATREAASRRFADERVHQEEKVVDLIDLY